MLFCYLGILTLKHPEGQELWRVFFCPSSSLSNSNEPLLFAPLSTVARIQRMMFVSITMMSGATCWARRITKKDGKSLHQQHFKTKMPNYTDQLQMGAPDRHISSADCYVQSGWLLFLFFLTWWNMAYLQTQFGKWDGFTWLCNFTFDGLHDTPQTQLLYLYENIPQYFFFFTFTVIIKTI